MVSKVLTVHRRRTCQSQHPSFVCRGQGDRALLARFGFVFDSSFNAGHSLALAFFSFAFFLWFVPAVFPLMAPLRTLIAIAFELRLMLARLFLRSFPFLTILASFAFLTLAFLATEVANILVVLVSPWRRGGLLVSAVLGSALCCMPSLEGVGQRGCRALLCEHDLCSHLNLVLVHLLVLFHNTFQLNKIVDRELCATELELQDCRGFRCLRRTSRRFFLPAELSPGPKTVGETTHSHQEPSSATMRGTARVYVPT